MLAVSCVFGLSYRNDIANGATIPSKKYMILIIKLAVSSFLKKNENAYKNTGLAKVVNKNMSHTLGTSISKSPTNKRPTMAGIL